MSASRNEEALRRRQELRAELAALGAEADRGRRQGKRRDQQADMLTAATAHRRPYSEADLAVLRDPDVSHREAARILGRSLWAIRTKRGRIDR